jgi:hypothetical protein
MHATIATMSNRQPPPRTPPPLPPTAPSAAPTVLPSHESGKAGGLRLAGIAAVMSLLVAAFLIGTQMKWNVRPQQPGDSLGHHIVGGPAGPDASAVHALSLGEAEQTKRKQRDDETVRNKQRAEEAARIALEEDRGRKAADEERMAQEPRRNEAEERAVEQQALSDKLQKQKIAYEAIANHEAITLQDLPIAVQIGGGPPKQAVICPLDPDNLLDLSFDLAVPSNPLSEAEPFEATVHPTAEQRLSWQISAMPARTIDKDSNAKPIPLATISATDGQLVLKPARNEILGNQLFSLLRQSVLLVKARSPEQPDDTATVVKAIQLVRPVSLSSFTASLFDGPTSIKLPSPLPGANETGTGSIRHTFPRDATVEYEIISDFAPDGVQKQNAQRRTWLSEGSLSFVSLLACPPTPLVPQTPPTVVGLRVAFTDGLSHMTLTPKIEGPGGPLYNLDDIGRYVCESDDEFHKRVNILERKLANAIKAFCGPVDAVNGKKLDAFMTLHERDLKSHFQPEAYAAWVEGCQQIHREAAQVPRPGALRGRPGRPLLVTEAEFEQNIAPIRAQWQQVFVPRIQEWTADYAKRQQDQLTQTRQYFSCLRSPALVTVKRIAIVAVDKDGNKHPVILAREAAKESTQKETLPLAEASDSQPKL